MAQVGDVGFVAMPEHLRSQVASEVHRVGGRVTEVGNEVGGIHVSAFQSASVTATTAISIFVASAAHDASAIAKALGKDAEQVKAAGDAYGAADLAGARDYDRLGSAWGIGP